MAWSIGVSQYQQRMGLRSDNPQLPILNEILFPGEEVIAAVAGTESLQPSVLIASPLKLIYMHLTAAPSVVIYAMNEVMGYEAVPRWGNWDLRITLTSGSIGFGNIPERQVKAFAQSLEYAYNTILPSGRTPMGEGLLMQLDDVVASLNAPEADLASSLPVGLSTDQAIGSDALRLCVRCLGGSEPSLAQAEVVFALGYVAGRKAPIAWPASQLRYDIDLWQEASLDDLNVVTIAQSLASTSSVPLAKVRGLLFDFLDTFALLAGSQERGAQQARARELRSATQSATRSGSTFGLDQLLTELDGLTGLDSVKSEVRGLANLVRVQEMRAAQGLVSESGMSRHLVFTGNPGTGKTTVARLVAQLYCALGVLPDGQLVEVSRGDLVAGYVGQTAIRTTQAFDQARGGVLFIDEAYALSRSDSGMDYGREAIDTLVKLMEDHREDTAVIVAGYPAEMQEFLASNPGLRSRFGRVIDFPDYSSPELLQIARREAGRNGYALTREAEESVTRWLDGVPRGHGFGNGRVVRQLVEDTIVNQANRVAVLDSPTAEDLRLLKAADVPVVMPSEGA